MAVLDTLKNEIVIRVVYDGPPEAGKTTSLRALAGSFGQTSVTPEENAEGRTQWFDWMEYVGGRFEGSQIRCQIITVPGQRELGQRRRALIASADAIVFVGDTSPGRWQLTLDYLTELYRMRDVAPSTIGIVFQANKRDVPNAISLAEIRARMGDTQWGVGVIESTASDGTGIREAFVYAVRLALDRVRDLTIRGRLVERCPDDATPDALLSRLRAAEQPHLLPPAEVAWQINQLDSAWDSDPEDRADEQLVARSVDSTLAFDPQPSGVESSAQVARDQSPVTNAHEPEPPPAAHDSLAAPSVDPPDGHESLEQTAAPWSSIESPPIDAPARPAELAITPSINRIEGPPDSLAAALLREVLNAEVEAAQPAAPPPPRHAASTPPRPPDASVPSGAIWPPVEGRATLLEVSQIELLPRRHTNGDWSAGLGSGWRLISKRDALFESLDAGRNALVQWARLHAACTSVVSPRRCIVLAATGDGRWRLWQIVRAEESLRDLVERATCEPEPHAVIDSLCQTAELLVEVHERLARAPCELPCSLDTIGACDASGMYIGLMPETPADPGVRVPLESVLVNELGPMLAHDLAQRRADLEYALRQKSNVSDHSEIVIESLERLLQ